MWVAIAYAVVSAVSQISQGQQQSKILKSQAAGYDQQAEAIRRKAAYDAQIKGEANKRALSTAEAMLATSGAELNDSPLDFLVDQTKQMELDRQMILYNGTVEANRYQHQAAISRAQASNAVRNGYMGALTSVLGTAASLYAGGKLDGLMNSSSAAASGPQSMASMARPGDFYNPTTGTLTIYSPNADINGPSVGGLY